MTTDEHIDQAVNPQAAEALREAEKQFIREALRRSLTAQVANRFFIQLEGDKVSLAIGGMGTAAVGEVGPEPLVPEPISAVANVYRVDADFLREMVKVINSFFPPEAPQKTADGE